MTSVPRTQRFAPLTLAALLAAMLAPAALAGEPAAHRVTKGDVVVLCPLTVGGSFEARTAAVTGELTPAAAKGEPMAGTLSVDLATLDTGIDLRSRHLRENYLEVAKGEGYAVAVLSDVVLEAESPADHRGKAPFRATLSLHGTKKDVSGTAEIREEEGALRVEATFPVLVSEFAIPKPSYLGVGVKNEVRVKVSLRVERAGAAK